jgi:hypothetical protein
MGQVVERRAGNIGFAVQLVHAVLSCLFVHMEKYHDITKHQSYERQKQVDSATTLKSMNVAVGISSQTPRLHAKNIYN